MLSPLEEVNLDFSNLYEDQLQLLNCIPLINKKNLILQSLGHPNLLPHIDIYTKSIFSISIIQPLFCKKFYKTLSEKQKIVPTIVKSILSAKLYLQLANIPFFYFCESDILINEYDIKLKNYSLHYLMDCIAMKNPSDDIRFISPDYFFNPTNAIINPCIITWSLAVYLFEFLFDVKIWSKLSYKQKLFKLLSYGKGNGTDVFQSLKDEYNIDSQLFANQIDRKISEFMEYCFNPISVTKDWDFIYNYFSFPETNIKIENKDSVLSPFETNYLIKIVNKNLKSFSKGKIENDHSYFPILNVPSLLPNKKISEENNGFEKAHGYEKTNKFKSKIMKYTRQPLDMSYLTEKLFSCHMDDKIFEDEVYTIKSENFKETEQYLATESRCGQNSVFYVDSTLLNHKYKKTIPTINLDIKENDVCYQYKRLKTFRTILDKCPYQLSLLKEAAMRDICPFYRNEVWAYLLDVGTCSELYNRIDISQYLDIERQIEVDIPRCHQYNETLATDLAHVKFKRILKAWIISHPQYVYWQGLDSLCAPFLYLNFHDESMAYGCLSSFIDKYLYNFFLKENSNVIKEYLSIFTALIAFHDPELYKHMEKIAFHAELFAIPWFLTAFAHILPLQKIFHLWDTLLLQPESFPLFISLALVQHLRTSILSSGFNEAILLFSDLSDLDIGKTLDVAKEYIAKTPESLVFRFYGNLTSHLNADKSPKANEIKIYRNSWKWNIRQIPHVFKSDIPIINLNYPFNHITLFNFCKLNESITGTENYFWTQLNIPLIKNQSDLIDEWDCILDNFVESHFNYNVSSLKILSSPHFSIIQQIYDYIMEKYEINYLAILIG